MAQRKPQQPRSHPNWPPSTCMRRVSMWGPKRLLWRCPPVTIPSRCAASARPRSTQRAGLTGWPRAGARPAPGKRPGSMGSRCLRAWRAGALRCCGSIRTRGSRARGGPRVRSTTGSGDHGSRPLACWPPRSAPRPGVRAAQRSAAAGPVADLYQPAHPAYAKGPDADEHQAPARRRDVTGETAMASMRAMLAGAKLVIITWLSVIFGDKGRCRTTTR
jgi:hypothetical protein